MKTPHSPYGTRVAVGLGLLASSWCFAASQPTNGLKDHQLFIGSDFSVKKDGEYRRVAGAGNASFLIEMRGRTVEVPLSKLPDIRITRGLKLTNLAATIDHIDAVTSSDEAIAMANESAQNSMELAVQAELARDHAQGAMLQAELSRVAYSSPAGYASPSRAIAQGILDEAAKSFANTQLETQRTIEISRELMVKQGSARTNDSEEVTLIPWVGVNAITLNIAGERARGPTAPPTDAAPPKQIVSRRVRDLSGGRPDRFDLEFTVSAAQPLESAYVVLVTEYTVPSRSAEVYRRVLTKRVDRIDAKPKKLSLSQTGFHSGFVLQDYSVLVYAAGQEVATNLSDTRMALTRDEAYQYLFADYLAQHQGETRPPAAILLAPRAELARQSNFAESKKPIYVFLDREGQVTRISADEKGTHDVSPSARASLDHFRFIPALEKGVPVQGRAKLVVADFIR